MAPNNALSSPKDEKQSTTPKQARTTILQSGTVEARGMGTNVGSREVIASEIQEFLKGEGRLSLKAETRAFFTVWTFITRLPGPTWVDHHPGYLMRGMAYFPIAGTLVGIFVGTFYDLFHTTLSLPSTIAAGASIASSFWVTGCFHEDGLADASDGIGGGWSRQQILRIMTDTRLGTYGCAVLLLYTVTKLNLLAALGESVWEFGHCQGAGPALIVSHTVARFNSSYLIRTQNYVDEGGPKYKFYAFMLQARHLVSWHRVIFAAVSSFAVTAAVFGLTLATTLVTASLVTGHLAGMYGEYLLGGIMGDFLGATICVTELVVLTGILVKDSVNELVVYANEIYGKMDTMDQAELMVLLEDPRISTLLRFCATIFLCTVWCCFVGHPNVLVRETVISNQEKDDDEIRISLDTTAKKSCSDKTKLSSIIKDKDSFMAVYKSTREYIDSLAKPVGSLGVLEDWAARISAIQGTRTPQMEKVSCIIFAADHGMAADPTSGGEGCSAFPQAVTRSILQGLARGVAGASVFASENNVSLKVIDVGVNGDPIGDGSGVVVCAPNKLKIGTRNACVENAMTMEEVADLLEIGRQAIRQAVESDVTLVALGEVGIGNTTASSCLIAALCECDIADVCDGGATTSRTPTKESINKKVEIVRKALKKHDIKTSRFQSKQGRASPEKALDILTKLGGAEIVALVGAMTEAANTRVPIMVDGFIVTIAAMVACLMSPRVCSVLIFATKSAEKGHKLALETIAGIAKSEDLPYAPPALDMGLRMGEGTGALLAVPLARSACAMLNKMATIQDILNEALGEEEC